jgi:hypothetical protein
MPTGTVAPVMNLSLTSVPFSRARPIVPSSRERYLRLPLIE